MAAARKKPQDHNPKATETPKAVTVTVRERDWEIDAAAMDDIEFLEDIASLNAGNPAILPGFCRRLLGDEQYESAKDMVRGESGRVRPAELMELVQEILQAPSSAVVPVGESSAS